MDRVTYSTTTLATSILWVCRGESGLLLRRRRRATSCLDDASVATPPSKWPGVESMLALLTREREESGPSLLLLLLESFAAVYLALFSFAFAAYDSRFLHKSEASSGKQTSTVPGGCTG